MQTYIGCKIIQAEPMDECAFLEKEKKQDCFGRVTRKEVFEEAYRPISLGEKSLISKS